MVFVPEGKFLMGSTDEQIQAATEELLRDCSTCQQASDWFVDQKPQHTVYLDAFWTDKFEVTNALYQKCAVTGKCAAPSESKSFSRSSYYGNSQYDNFPVIYVSWNDAKTFCEWAGKRLPTEAEWEKAARGDKGRLYPWGNEWTAARVNAEERIKETAAIGSYPDDVSLYGAMDMGGNVREWVSDWYDENYYSHSPQNNPPGAPSGQLRVLRGGSWGGYMVSALAASRVAYDPATQEHYIGFRCAQSFK